MQKILCLVVMFLAVSCAQHQTATKKEPKVLMAILAHPDDESALGQVLAKYAREGKKVYLVIATDGRYGTSDHAGIPPGDSLARIRKNESICAAEVLGIEPPIFLDLHDVFGLLTGLDEYFIQTRQAKDKIAAIIKQINPDILITFGPDGDTGHLDHKGISDLVTEVVLREGWYEKYPLYFLAWPKEKEVWIPQGSMSSLNYVDKKYRNVHITYSKEDRDKLFHSLDCFKTQFTENDVKQWIEAELRDSTFTTYFRRFVTDTTIQSSFFLNTPLLH